MKKTKIILHIGYGKTATTTLQQHFFPYIEEIDYLGKLDNNGKFKFESNYLLNVLLNKRENIDFKLIEKELRKYYLSDTILLSDESILSTSLKIHEFNDEKIINKPEEIAQRLRKLFSEENYNVKILITLRKQDEMITSRYAQSYTHYYSHYEESNTFKKYLNIFLDKEHTHIYKKALNFNDTVGVFQKEFGNKNVNILLYEELQKKPEYFYEKLCNILEIDIDKYKLIALNKHTNKRSTSNGYKKTQSLTLYNRLQMIKKKLFPFIKLKVTDRQKRMLESIILNKNNQINRSIILSDNEKSQIKETYKESNIQLSKRMQLDLDLYGYYDE